jgi:hypothetical protein
MKSKHRTNKRLLIYLLVFLTLFLSRAQFKVNAQENEINWGSVINISNMEGFTSTDPFLLSDPAGMVHLFWAQKVTFAPGNQPDTIMYTSWDGFNWSNPIDIRYSPPGAGNMLVSYPHAVIDDFGKIHLIWLEQPNFPHYTLYYSSVNAWEAGIARAWSAPAVLANDLIGTKYSIDIAYRSPNELNILYARGQAGLAGTGDRDVVYIKSEDNGSNWSDPVEIYTVLDVERGASDTRLLLENPSNIYATWTEWDGTGNGQVVYFARSLDNGQTWDSPLPLSVRTGDEYERDWTKLALLGENQIVAIWEGGFRAYRHAMYSYDAGATWSEPIDTFPFLIGDNGFVDFAWDSSGKLHVFLAQRIREGFSNRFGTLGLWHSTWVGGKLWREPTLVTREGGAENITNPKVTIVNGNKIVAVWYGSQIYEIMALTGEIVNAPYVASRPWNLPIPTPEISPTATHTVTYITPTPYPSPLQEQINEDPTLLSNQGTAVIYGTIPSFIIIIVLLLYKFSGSSTRKNQ